jgi:hypothetical protein
MDDAVPPPVPLNSEEYSSSVMVYTDHLIIWGEVVIKKQFRASTWLVTNAAPEQIHLFNTKSIPVVITGTPKPIPATDAFIQLSEVRVFHLVPPNFDPIDYDPNEPNMQMLPVRIQSGPFRVEGGLRISTRANLSSYLDIIHQSFLEIHAATISTALMPTFGKVLVLQTLVRKSNSIICSV